jgi:endoglucanase
MRLLIVPIVAIIALLMTTISPALASPSLSAAQWSAYKGRFLRSDGRIVDDANGNISHSEGQGYGLLLAYLAGSRADFDLIWTFTQNELLIRDDHLAAWKWDPASNPHVTDINNATDGDILIAYALALAGRSWGDRKLLQSAIDMVKALDRVALVRDQGNALLLPGASGFSRKDRPDGPVVNLSYWVFEAFPLFTRLDPQGKWSDVAETGIRLLHQAAFGPRRLPPDWLSLSGRPTPAKGFPNQFGYNALRIPLYLVRAGIDDDAALQRLAAGMTIDGDVGVVDLPTGAVEQKLDDPGYRIIPALASCFAGGPAVPRDLMAFVPTSYFPSTLHLLALSYLAEHGGKCR